MPTSRSYQDACPIARALDVIGERWALLVVRELLLGPQRFSDLRRGLPKASSNLLADRLRELRSHGAIQRHKLPPPAGSWVYELTDWGRELEPIVLILGQWGMRRPLPPAPTTLSATSILLYLRGSARPDPAAPPTTYRFELDNSVWTVRAGAGQVRIKPGEPVRPEASLRTTPEALNAFLDDPATLDTALADGTTTATGDLQALRQLLRTAGSPDGSSPDSSKAGDSNQT